MARKYDDCEFADDARSGYVAPLSIDEMRGILHARGFRSRLAHAVRHNAEVDVLVVSADCGPDGDRLLDLRTDYRGNVIPTLPNRVTVAFVFPAAPCDYGDTSPV